MEMALHSTATVLQRLEPYWQAEEEVTCLKADAPDEWQDQLLRLVRDPVLRRRIGESARAVVLAGHTLEARRPLWEALVTEVSDRWLTAPEKRHDPLEDIVIESNNAPEVSG